MAITLAESKVGMSDHVEQAVVDEFRRGSYMLDHLTFDNAVSPGTGGSTLVYGYTQLLTPSTAGFREINSEYTSNEAKRTKKQCELKIFGGKYSVDRVIQETSSGILASCGCNSVDEGAWTYKTKTKRDLEKKYSEGDTWTNTELTKSGGIKMVYVNENGDKQKYGVAVKNKGITVYDGNSISKYPAEKITVSDNADSVEYITANGVKAALELVWNGDILTSFKRRFTDENGKEIFDDDKENENV